MSANLENSAVVTELEKVSFHSSPKVLMIIPKNVQTIVHLHSFHMLARLCSKSFKLGFVVHEPRTSRCINCVLMREWKNTSNWQQSLAHKKTRGFQKNVYFCFIDYAKAFDCVETTNFGKLNEMQVPEDLFPKKLVCRSRSNRTEGRTTD